VDSPPVIFLCLNRYTKQTKKQNKKKKNKNQKKPHNTTNQKVTHTL